MEGKQGRVVRREFWEIVALRTDKIRDEAWEPNYFNEQSFLFIG
jgi:hypothetical protein